LLCKKAGKEMEKVHKKLKRQNRIIHLTAACQDNPLLVFQRFFEDYHLNELRNDLWDWLYATLSDDNDTYNNYKERDDVLFLYYRLLELGEAGLILIQSSQGKRTRLQ
jgi:hypothetical protein